MSEICDCECDFCRGTCDLEEGHHDIVDCGKEIILKRSSWENIIECLHESTIKSKGNFWAAIQHIEDQLVKKKREVRG